VAMAGIAIFEWEMLFPDNLDFLVLTPLPLRGWQMPAAKAAALAMFLGLFLGAANFFGVLMLPAVANANIGRQIAAHAIATLSAGIFGALAVMLLGGVLVCSVPARLYRSISLVFRMLAVTVLGLVVIHYARFGDSMPGLLADGGQRMRWIPTFWFLGLYEAIQHGGAAPEFARAMTHRADTALAVLALGLMVVYPLAWNRMRRMAIEEQVNRGAKQGRWSRAAVHAIVRRPEERAVFHFIGKAMARNSRYHVYVAIYFGAGLALAISCAMHVRTVNGIAEPSLSAFGLHAVMPLLVFWVIAGLKMAFAFPLQLHARWIFRSTRGIVVEVRRRGEQMGSRVRICRGYSRDNRSRLNWIQRPQLAGAGGVRGMPICHIGGWIFLCADRRAVQPIASSGKDESPAGAHALPGNFAAVHLRNDSAGTESREESVVADCGCCACSGCASGAAKAARPRRAHRGRTRERGRRISTARALRRPYCLRLGIDVADRRQIHS